jgi:N-formylglutamate amidohydrolase
VLLDCHSMPARTGGARKEPEIVFGDRYGTSIAPDYFNAAIAAAEAQGFTTARNHPYAGGHITARHGRPGAGIHALQIEIDRAAYLAPDMRSPGPGFDRTARMIAAVAEAIATRIADAPAAIAAE